MTEETKIDYPFQPAKNVHQAVVNVMSQVGYVRKQRGGNLGYSYAGEAALIEALRPYMVDNGLYVRVEDVEFIQQREYQSKNGAAMNEVILKLVMVFTHAASDTSVRACAIGMGSDTGDKSSNKAMTGGYKYALRELFMIETGDDPDKDPSVEAALAKKQPKQSAPVRKYDLVEMAASLGEKLGNPNLTADALKRHMQEINITLTAGDRASYEATYKAIGGKLKREQDAAVEGRSAPAPAEGD